MIDMSEPSIKYSIREIEESDIENGGLLEVLENLAPVGGLTIPGATAILKEIKSNPLHKIYVAVVQEDTKQVVRQPFSLNQSSSSVEDE